MLQFYRLVLHVAKKLARGEKPPRLYSGHTTVQCTVCTVARVAVTAARRGGWSSSVVHWLWTRTHVRSADTHSEMKTLQTVILL